MTIGPGARLGELRPGKSREVAREARNAEIWPYIRLKRGANYELLNEAARPSK